MKRNNEVDPARFVLIHGSGDVGWYWHLVDAELRARGHDVVTMDLPVEDDSADLSTYADAVIDAIGSRRTNLVVVAQSFGGYTAPIVCDRVQTKLLVLVAGMVPAPGETSDEMWANTRYGEDGNSQRYSELALFYHDVPEALAREALSRGRPQSETPGREPWPLAAWPNVPTKFILCRNDRLFPRRWLQRVVRDRLGITPDEIDSGHCPALSRPRALADMLSAHWTDLEVPGSSRVSGR